MIPLDSTMESATTTTDQWKRYEGLTFPAKPMAKPPIPPKARVDVIGIRRYELMTSETVSAQMDHVSTDSDRL